MITFALRDMLKKRGMTQSELVETTGIRQPTLSAISTGKIKTIPVRVMDKICQALDCQPGDLFEYVPDEKTPQD